MPFKRNGYILQWASKEEKSFFDPLSGLIEKAKKLLASILPNLGSASVSSRIIAPISSIVNSIASKRNEWSWNDLKKRIEAFKTNDDPVDEKSEIFDALERDLLEIESIGISPEEYKKVMADYKEVCRLYWLPKFNSNSKGFCLGKK